MNEVEGASAAEVCGTGVPGSRNSMFKDPQAGMNASFENSECASLIKSVSQGEGCRQ